MTPTRPLAWTFGVAAALCALPASVVAAPAGGTALASTARFAVAPSGTGSASSTREVAKTLSAKLRASGRAEVKIERVSFDPFSGAQRAVSGTLALERPDRASLEFPATGERVTVRGDGGEWLQPQLKQLVRFRAVDAAGASRWWSLLLDPNVPGFTARRLSERRYVLADTRTQGVADSAWITLGDDGMPVRLEVAEGPGEKTLYRFRSWRFLPALGRTAFEQKAPRDYQVVRLE